jgi:hypothetical protein
MIGFSINMVNAVEGKKKVKVLTSAKKSRMAQLIPLDKSHLSRFTRKSLASRKVKLKWVNPLNPE